MPVGCRDWWPGRSGTFLKLAPLLIICEATLCRKACAPSRGRAQTPARLKAREAIRLMAAGSLKGRYGARQYRKTTRLAVVGRPHRRYAAKAFPTSCNKGK